MRKKERAEEAVRRLKEKYPTAICSLDYRDAYRLLVSVRLSAQCTDARVNIVCRELFDTFPDLASLAEAPLEEIERIVKPCGFYHGKASDIKRTCTALLQDYGGEVPRTMEKLLKLPGVGRKSANLILGDIYGMPGAVVADTHCIRIAGRLGLTDTKDPHKVELALRALLPPDESNDFCHRLVLFGRETCRARGPRCDACELCDICKERGGRP